ncbi:hypothetical protein LJB71_08100 [Thermomonas sp. S9]|uniref:hypothetical protein n=1 Tax=Thermomonas sp. S9 TaxID=2885203 RepID=UPI00216B0E55|nr:hypothetical protein [Thermomonas sp. S9]MCR6496176.1 hypothetical protein [Thermomonas sp. S9]
MKLTTYGEPSAALLLDFLIPLVANEARGAVSTQLEGSKRRFDRRAAASIEGTGESARPHGRG